MSLVTPATASIVQLELRGAHLRSSHRRVGVGRSGGSGLVCRVSGQLSAMHEPATAIVLCLASRFSCSVSLRTARSESQDNRWTACVALTVMCILSKNKTCVCLMGPDQDLRDVKRVTGA